MTEPSQPAGDIVARNDLVLRYRPLVERVASGMAATLPRHLNRDDLVADGLVGLMDAIDKFDPSLGGFETFAKARIRGAILDGLRTMTWATKRTRTRSRQLDQARNRLYNRLHRPPSEDEIAAEMGVTVDRMRFMVTEQFETAEVWYTNDTRLDGSTPDGTPTKRPSLTRELRHLEIEQGDDSIDFPINVATLREALTDAVDRLPVRERMVFILYYVEELTMNEIGELFGVVPARVMQLRNSAIEQLHASIAEPEPAGS